MPQRSSPCPCAVKSFCVCHPIFEPRRPSDAGAARLCARCSFTGTHSPAMHLAFMGISPLRGSLRGALLCCDGSHRRSDFAGSFPPNGEKPACSATPPLPLSPSSHLTRREVLPCFNARHQDWTQVSLMLLPVMAFDAVAPHRLSRERLSDAPLIRLAGFPTAEGK